MGIPITTSEEEALKGKTGVHSNGEIKKEA
jgi:hypothetical protein